MASIDPYLRIAAERHARKLVLRPGQQPVLVFDNSQTTPFGQPIPGDQIRIAVLQVIPPDAKPKFMAEGQVNIVYTNGTLSFQVYTRPFAGGVEAQFVNQEQVSGKSAENRNDNAGGKPGAEAILAATQAPIPNIGPLMQSPPTREMPAMAAATSNRRIDTYLRRMIDYKASDLHVCVGRKARYRVDGDLKEREETEIFTTDSLRTMLWEITREDHKEDFEKSGSCDFAYELQGIGRFRFNIYKDHRGLAAVARLIPSKVLTAEQLNLPKCVRNLSNLPKGLVLVTGPTGSGKSTTLAGILDLVNRTRHDHILTIEAPIEFVHQDQRCLVNQREVGNHTTGFKDALRDALREDPDVVLIGEMRDLETISTAIETASTGHLVFGTLHTTTAPSTVNRIIEIFPADQQAQVRYGLAESLKAVISQTLLKRKGGGRVAALEILMVTSSVANLIREQKTHQLLNVMQTGKSLGMQLLNDELLRLVREGTVDASEAYQKAVDKAEILRQFKVNGVDFTAPDDAQLSG